MKTAVFQVNECGGRTRLICVPMPSLRAAAILESWLKMHADLTADIRFLGRFDCVHTVFSQQEAEALMLNGGEKPATLANYPLDSSTRRSKWL
ncbi:MAG TPA: hypothetical protein VGK24_18880 [Candidatus Angelobacter sp.]|jgi:hypothetical protein